MFEQKTPVSFFLGANTPMGFKGYLDDLYDGKDGWRAMIIKSGPGTGKNTLMRAVRDAMEARGEALEAIYCSSDPSSLDGILCPRFKLCILDGTAPHVMEPKYWGAVESIVDLCCCMDCAQLNEKAEEIIRTTDLCSAAHARCRSLMGGAAALLRENAQIASTYTDFPKILRTAQRISRLEFGKKQGTPGKERRRFLSAVTPEGNVILHKTVQTLCGRIYALEDEYGAASRALLAELRRQALHAGLEIITCACPLAPEDKIEHLLIPSLGIAFITSNRWHKAAFPVFRRIHASRFTDIQGLRTRKQTLSFHRRAAKALLQEAVSAAVSAKAIHDRMEQFNIRAMDWAQAERIQTEVVQRFIQAADGASSVS